MMEIDLKQVFSIFDENEEGQIQLRRFVDVATNYYTDAEQLARITKALDPDNTGLINFDQFCDGISQISSLQGLTLKEVACDLTRRSRENSLVEDSDRRSLKTNNGFNFSSLSSWSNLIQEENQDGSTTTFNEYDVENEDVFHNKSQATNVQTSSSINNTTISQKPSNHTQNSNSNTSSLSPRLNSPFYGEEFIGVVEPATSVYPPDIVYPRTPTQRNSLMLKRNSYLQPSALDEPVEQQLQETVDDLQKEIETLHNQKQATTERLAKIQSENGDLKSRLLALEDRFHDLEEQQVLKAQSEQQRYTEYINQKDRSFLQEKEILQSRINAIEAELKQTHTVNGQMKKDVRDLKQKLEDVDIQLHDSQIRCNNLADDNEKLLEQLRLQREELEAEKLANLQLAEQLTYETSHSNVDRTLTRTESILRTSETRMEDLIAQIEQLKLENQQLKEENEELREHAVAAGVKEGRQLMTYPDTQSYAAELEVLSKDELVIMNGRLREYIDSLLVQILVNDPTILEKH